MTVVEPATHPPRPCPACGTPSTDIADDRCLPCRQPGAVHVVEPDRSPCTGCGQPLLLDLPGRTECERCTRGAPVGPNAPVEQQAPRAPGRCAGCGTEAWALADGHCMTCRWRLGMAVS